MTASPCTVSPSHIGEETVATSTSQGTVLPRSGVFWGVHPPQYRSAVVIGEFASSWTDGTQVRGWFEPHGHLSEQTSLTYSRADALRLMNFELDVDKLPSEHYSDLTSNRSATGSYTRDTALGFIREVDVACVFIPKWNDSTESTWRSLRHALAPLLTAPSVILEAIRAELERNKADSEQSQHVGLAAVALLTKILQLSRPTILRMGGVPESTFYSWQKNPQAVVRTPSISRILRLHAQVGILDKALGRDGLKEWILSKDHLAGLQGDDATFMQTLAEAEEAATRTIQIASRPRMRLEDYEFNSEESSGIQADENPSWPGASKLPEELAE
jgi:hypothetical protein